MPKHLFLHVLSPGGMHAAISTLAHVLHLHLQVLRVFRVQDPGWPDPFNALVM